ncbi:MAG: hypothetical protein ACP5HG_08765 [Anaerolineae bacterium]
MLSSLTARECLVAALTGQPVDHLPFSPFLAYVWETVPQAVRDAGQLAFHQRIGATPLWRGAPCPVRGVPFVLANSDSCPPGVTVEKFARVAEIARRHR